MKRSILQQDLYIPGLALTGFFEEFPFDRVQILGKSEILYLLRQTPVQQLTMLKQFFDFGIPCIIITNDNLPPPALLNEADAKAICVFVSQLTTSQLVSQLTDYLSAKFAPKMTVHGSLVDVYGVGLLLTGRSGIGKSEIALDLLERGHRLVADDVVTIFRRGRGILMGCGQENVQHHLEMRGVGIINVLSIFGIRALRFRKQVEVEICLEDTKDIAEFDRTGLETEYAEYLGIKIPLVSLPIFPGKNITVIVETIALNSLLKLYGYDAAKEFNNRLIRLMKQKHAGKNYPDEFLE